MLTRPEARSPPAPASLALPPAAYNSIGWTKGVQWSQICQGGLVTWALGQKGAPWLAWKMCRLWQDGSGRRRQPPRALWPTTFRALGPRAFAHQAGHRAELLAGGGECPARRA